jgi:serine/threonine protein kinase
LPGNGPEWANIRKGELPGLDETGYSNTLKKLIRMMMDPKPSNRPSAAGILEHFLLTESRIEMKWLKVCKRKLQEEVILLKEQVRDEIYCRSRSAEDRILKERNPFLD